MRFVTIALILFTLGGIVFLGVRSMSPPADHDNAQDTAERASGYQAFQELATGSLVNLTFFSEPLPAPRTPVLTEAGTERRLQDYVGDLVVVNFWATWCAPCRREMPALDRLQMHFAGRPFKVLAVSQDRNGAEVARAFFDEIGVENIELLLDPTTRLGREIGAFGLPLTVLIAPDGMVIGQLFGPAEWDAPEAIALIEALLSADVGAGDDAAPGARGT